MVVIQVDMTELSDVVDILQERGVEYAISYEPGVAYLYGSDDIIQQIQDILWARDVIHESGFQQETWLGHAVSMQK